MRLLIPLWCLLLVLQVNTQQYTTPVPILKQINRHNADGSYTYGYEAADKSFKIETKYPDGEVHGKYGYVDDQGQLREVEYGASKRGFEPQGSDINVAPPTLKSNNPYPLGPNEIDDGQYREDPAVYYKGGRNPPLARFNQNSYQPPPPPPPQPQWSPPPAPQRNIPVSRFSLDDLQQSPPPRWSAPPNPAPQYYQPPQPRYQPPAPQPQYYNPPPPSYNAPYRPGYANTPTHHHPALRNIDISSGSYSIDYTGRK